MRYGRVLEAVLILLVFVGLIASGWTLAARAGVPQGGRQVELVFRLETVYEASRLHGIPVDVLLETFRAAGVTTLAVEAKSLSRLEYAGQAVVVPAHQTVLLAGGLGEPETTEPLAQTGFYLVSALGSGPADRVLSDWLTTELVRWAPRGLVFSTPTAGAGRSFVVPFPARHPATPRGQVPPPPPAVARRPVDPSVPDSMERDLVLGLSPLDLELAWRHGFLVVAVIPNRVDITAAEAVVVLESLGDGQGFSAVKFDGPAALGWPDQEALQAVGRRLAEVGLPFIVDKPQAGLEDVARAAGWRGVRQQPVWTRVDPGRFPEVARERRATFLYFENAFFEGFPADWLGTVTQAVRDIVAALEDEGLRLGQTVPLQAWSPSTWQVVLGVSGVFAAAGLILLWLLQPRAGRPVSVPPGLVAAVALVWAGPTVLALAGTESVVLSLKAVTALAAGLTFPVLGVWLGLRWALATPETQGRLWRMVVGVLLAGAGPVAGGLMGLAVASDTTFMLYLRTSLGVKVSLLLPPLAAAFLFLAEVGIYQADQAGGRSVFGRGVQQLSRLLAEDITFGKAASLGLAAVAALVLITRSGNFPILPPSEAESSLRAFLQQALLVRPRTKEFLIGWPSLVLLFWWGRAWTRTTAGRWAATALTLGAGVGLASVANTFAHLHVPPSVSLIRTANGLALGLLLGLASVVVVRATLATIGRSLRRGGGSPI